MNKTLSTPLSLISLAVISAFSTVAMAQTEDSQQQPAQHPKESYEQITVTAQKREQRLIEVPMSVSTLTQDDIEQKGLLNLQDLSFAVPGMTMREDGPGNYAIFMRGMSNLYGSGAMVGVYMDEGNYTIDGLWSQPDIRPIDFQRIEVLKGPQGTLYGSGSVAGTVRYITNEVDLGLFEGNVSASLASVKGGESKKNLVGVLNAPIVEDVFGVRIAATAERDGGWQDQPAAGIKDGNNQDLNHIRFKARWQISDAFNAHFTLVDHYNKSELGIGFENPDRTITVAVDPAKKLVPKTMDYRHLNLTLSYDFENMSLISSSSNFDYEIHFPISYVPQEGNNLYNVWQENRDWLLGAEQFTQELRLVSTSDDKFQWTIGAFYNDREYLDKFDVVDGSYLGNYYQTPNAYSAKSEAESIAVFADLTYDITDKLEIGFGIRKYREDKVDTDRLTNKVQKGSFDTVTKRVQANYLLSDNKSIYASISEGFRSGGFNPGDYPSYGPEDIVSYEIGTKGAMQGGKISYDASLYFTQYNDMIRRAILDIGGGNLLDVNSNIGQVDIKGLEAGGRFYLTDDLSFTATISLIDAEIVKLSNEAVNKVGDDVDYTPDLAYTLGVNYDFSVASVPAYARLDYSYRDKVSYIDRSSFSEQAAANQFSDELNLLSGRVGFFFDNDVTLEIYAENLTDQNKYIDPYHGWSNANRTKPRMFGVKVSYSF